MFHIRQSLGAFLQRYRIGGNVEASRAAAAMQGVLQKRFEQEGSGEAAVRTFRNGDLTIGCSSAALASEIQSAAEQLRRDANVAIGHELIRRIRIRVE